MTDIATTHLANTELSTQRFLDFTLAHEWGAPPQPAQQLANGTQMEVWDSGVVCFTPTQEAQPLDIVLSCAVHGDETAPIEIVDELIEAIRSGALQLRTRVLFLIANPAAVNIGKRFVEENMNRLFSGAHSQGASNRERERASHIERYVQRFFNEHNLGAGRERLHYDMHTAIRDSQHQKFAVYPYTNGEPYSRRQLQLLAALDVPVVLLHDGPTTTFSYFSVNTCNAAAFTLELGKVAPFGQNDMAAFAGTKAQLQRLLTEGVNLNHAPSADTVILYQVRRSINRTAADFQLAFADNIANFTSFQQGDLLAQDGETSIYAEIDGEAVIFPNAKVALGQRALLTVEAIASSTINLV